LHRFKRLMGSFQGSPQSCGSDSPENPARLTRHPPGP
jgi:hypothetical protein